MRITTYATLPDKRNFVTVKLTFSASEIARAPSAPIPFPISPARQPVSVHAQANAHTRYDAKKSRQHRPLGGARLHTIQVHRCDRRVHTQCSRNFRRPSRTDAIFCDSDTRPGLQQKRSCPCRMSHRSVRIPRKRTFTTVVFAFSTSAIARAPSVQILFPAHAQAMIRSPDARFINEVASR